MSNNLLHDIEMQAKTIEQLMTRCEVLDGAWTTANAQRMSLEVDRNVLSLQLDVLKADLASEIALAKQYSDQSDALLLENNELRKALTEIVAFDDSYVLFGHDYAMFEIARVALGEKPCASA